MSSLIARRPWTLRRLAGLALALGALALMGLGFARAQEAARPVVRVGALKFGTLSWELEAIRKLSLDRANGVAVETLDLANNEAGRIAILSGAADVIVSDWTFVARERAEGGKLTFAPFSSSYGALVAAKGGTLADWAELRGRKIGVAGGPLDKSWALLQAAVQRKTGVVLARDATPVYGAPPLLVEKLKQGELDYALLFWNFVSRLETEGYAKVLPMSRVETELGASGRTVILGYVFDESRQAAPERAAAILGFLKAANAAKTRLKEDPALWNAVRPLMQANSDAAFEALKAGYLNGIPTRSIAQERDDAEKLYGVLYATGGEKLMGKSSVLPEGVFFAQAPTLP